MGKRTRLPVVFRVSQAKITGNGGPLPMPPEKPPARQLLIRPAPPRS
jgi:hypothetical protein